MFKVGDKVTTDIWPDMGLGEIISISEAGSIWVKWPNVNGSRSNHLHKPNELVRQKDPNDLLKEIL